MVEAKVVTWGGSVTGLALYLASILSAAIRINAYRCNGTTTR